MWEHAGPRSLPAQPLSPTSPNPPPATASPETPAGQGPTAGLPDAGAAAVQGRAWRLRGIVQGVGLRPQVLRLAVRHGLVGRVYNEGTAAVVEAFGAGAALQAFHDDLRGPARGGLRLDHVAVQALPVPQPLPPGFAIVPSSAATPGLGVAPDWASCAACVAETLDPASRRHRYAFTACTDCGPRLSVFLQAPYDRAHTTLAGFPLCGACQAEYGTPDDRRFHAQAMACPVCGPAAQLRLAAEPDPARTTSGPDAVAAAARLLDQGELLLVKGLGGYQLACSATSAAAVQALRALKQREGKPFALMARDLTQLRQWCTVDAVAEAALTDPSAPIVLLPRRLQPEGPPLAEGVAPGLAELGVMLPPTPLHHLLMAGRAAPLVLTSGNLSGEPQATTLDQAADRLGAGRVHVLDHNRPIARRVDDSVGRVIDGAFRVMRRARGLAPAPLPLPPGFDGRTRVLALGGDLKNTFALLRDGQAVLSQHIGDLHDLHVLRDQQRALDDYLQFYAFDPDLVVADAHPGYAATPQAAARWGPRLVQVGHHHAHIAACLGEHGWPLHGGDVLGLALDGIGLGDDGQLWGGEFLRCSYARSQRLAHLRPTPLPGGDQAAREPWRNTYAQLVRGPGWDAVQQAHGGLPLLQFLAAQPRAVLDRMLDQPRLAPPASSTGRLFDAVAAAVGLCRDRVAYEGEAAMRLEALVDAPALQRAQGSAYPLAVVVPAAAALSSAGPAAGVQAASRPWQLDPAPLWEPLLQDLAQGTPAALMAARFHVGLADAVVQLSTRLAHAHGLGTVALGGGVFQNRVFTEQVMQGLRAAGLQALLPRQVPTNDGGLAWGQALIALARQATA